MCGNLVALEFRRFLAKDGRWSADPGRDDLPPVGLELRSFGAHLLEDRVDIVAALAGVLVAGVADFGEDFVFVHGSRFINSVGAAMTGHANPAVSHARSMRRTA